MNREKCIVTMFRESFSNRRREKFVLYGLSGHTEEIVSGCPEFTFLGLLDGFQESGELYGLPVLSLTQVAKLSASLFEERTGRRVDGVAYADPKAFEDKLREAGFYAEWKKTYGDEAWAILEAAIGRTLA